MTSSLSGTDLTAALPNMDAYLAVHEGEPDHYVIGDNLTDQPFTLGDLRALRAALARPYVPGMVEVDQEGYERVLKAGGRRASLALRVGNKTSDLEVPERRHFVEVTK